MPAFCAANPYYIMTKILNLATTGDYWGCIDEAICALKAGRVIAFPTETVYGLGANADDPAAVSLLYEIKGRPQDKKFTILAPDKSAIEKYVDKISPLAQKLIDKFWPGPLTLVLPAKNGGDIGLRIPNHKVINDLLSGAKFPIAAPSANLSGREPASDAEHVFETFKGAIDIILDGGSPPMGTASTVARVNGGEIEILRSGAVPDKEIYACMS